MNGMYARSARCTHPLIDGEPGIDECNDRAAIDGRLQLLVRSPAATDPRPVIALVVRCDGHHGKLVMTPAPGVLPSLLALAHVEQVEVAAMRGWKLAMFVAVVLFLARSCTAKTAGHLPGLLALPACARLSLNVRIRLATRGALVIAIVGKEPRAVLLLLLGALGVPNLAGAHNRGDEDPVARHGQVVVPIAALAPPLCLFAERIDERGREEVPPVHDALLEVGMRDLAVAYAVPRVGLAVGVEGARVPKVPRTGNEVELLHEPQAVVPLGVLVRRGRLLGAALELPPLCQGLDEAHGAR